MKLVLDASVAVAAVRPNEPSHAVSRARVTRILEGLDEFIVPAIFPIEVGASLARVGEPTAAVCAYVDALMSVAIDVATIGPLRARRIRDTAIASKLRAADSAYVWLAAQEAVPLCTLDREMTQRGSAFCRVIPP
ncbi:type II toxin-antitoxin system VapC family toxin [Sorangium sp. So ce185]|uniref:type II toxin-antitoxin system VapC family toxin n=1 Tax=Sorangium sp. So ce185 TaxID=3133287 RepID=UPI003F6207B8